MLFQLSFINIDFDEISTHSTSDHLTPSPFNSTTFAYSKAYCDVCMK